MVQRPGIFPTFFLSGFECSTFLWGKDRVRRNLVAETGHDRHAAEDYARLARLGIYEEFVEKFTARMARITPAKASRGRWSTRAGATILRASTRSSPR